MRLQEVLTYRIDAHHEDPKTIAKHIILAPGVLLIPTLRAVLLWSLLLAQGVHVVSARLRLWCQAVLVQPRPHRAGQLTLQKICVIPHKEVHLPLDKRDFA